MRTLNQVELERKNVIELFELSNEIFQDVKQKEKRLALPIDHEDLFDELMELDLSHIAVAAEIGRRTNKVMSKVGNININLN